MKAAIKAAFLWAAGFLEARSGPSSTRLIMLAGTLIPLTVWTALSIYYRRMEVIPESVLFFVGLCMGLKAADKTIASRTQVAEIEKHKPVAETPESVSVSKTVQLVKTETK